MEIRGRRNLARLKLRVRLKIPMENTETYFHIEKKRPMFEFRSVILSC